jgi:hypothetical protein
MVINADTLQHFCYFWLPFRSLKRDCEGTQCQHFVYKLQACAHKHLLLNLKLLYPAGRTGVARNSKETTAEDHTFEKLCRYAKGPRILITAATNIACTRVLKLARLETLVPLLALPMHEIQQILIPISGSGKGLWFRFEAESESLRNQVKAKAQQLTLYLDSGPQLDLYIRLMSNEG